MARGKPVPAIEERIIKISREGVRWRVHVDPPHEHWPDDFEETEERALALARCRRFATRWEIEGHPRKRSVAR